MRKTILIVLVTLLFHEGVKAQYSTEAAFEKLMQLTGVFSGLQPYSCRVIVEVKYKGQDALKDTSRLIYKNGLTWYKSRLAEHVEAAEGELIVNHELKTATLHISDSIRKVLELELNVEPDKEFESMLDADFEAKDMAYFRDYLTRYCNVVSASKDGLEELSFTPKDLKKATLLSLKIRFDENSKIRYYEYSNREVYATDWHGDSQFRIVKTIFDDFNYDNVANIPSRFTDFLEWKGWTVKLKKYKNYKLSVL